MDRYTARINMFGNSTRERELTRLKQTILNDSQSSLSYKAVVINGENKSLVIDSYEKEPTKKVIKSLPNETFQVGDYVTWFDNKWLVTKADCDDEVYVDGTMQLCNYTLKFQSPNGTILSYPCITSNTKFGNTEGKYVTLPSNQKSILLPFDDNTALLTADNRMYVDKRINPTPYEIIGDIDTTTYNYGDKGLIYFVVQQSLKETTTDRPDLGICNYFEPIVEPEPPVVGYSYASISYSGDLVVGGVTRTITPTFYEADNTINTGITAVWDIDLPVGYENQFTITYVGNQAKIKVAENYDLIEKTVVLNVMGSNGGYGGSLVLTITV